VADDGIVDRGIEAVYRGEGESNMSAGVSVIVPCYNEERTIGLLLEAIRDQTFSVDRVEVIIADGMSTDGTRGAIQAFQRAHASPKVLLVDNPARDIPSALNQALQHAAGDVVIRLDAHSVPRSDYIERCLAALERTGAANVGGVWEIEPSSTRWIARGIAAAASHPIGAGDARYRTQGKQGEVDTVPFGAFQRSWIERVGPFDETLLSNEDYEYNYRLRKAGGTIWFDPEIRSVYYARETLGALGRQYFRYGLWKARMLARHPESLRWRQALPAGFFLGLVVLSFGSLFIRPVRWLLALYLGGYCLVTLAAGAQQAVRKRDWSLMFGFPLSLWVMHLAWGAGFFWAILSSIGGEPGGRG